MKRRTYWIKNGEFANQYDVRYCESSKQEAIAEDRGYTRVARESAISAVRAERTRKRVDAAFSGFASAYIYPISAEEQDWQNYPYYKSGYFIEKES